MDFSDNCAILWYFATILTSSGFFKVSCSMEFERMSRNFLCYYVKIHWYLLHFDFVNCAWFWPCGWLKGDSSTSSPPFRNCCFESRRDLENWLRSASLLGWNKKGGWNERRTDFPEVMELATFRAVAPGVHSSPLPFVNKVCVSAACGASSLGAAPQTALPPES